MVYSKPFRTIKNRVRKGKMGVKNLLFSSKKQVFGRKKMASGQLVNKKALIVLKLLLKNGQEVGWARG